LSKDARALAWVEQETVCITSWEHVIASKSLEGVHASLRWALPHSLGDPAVVQSVCLLVSLGDVLVLPEVVVDNASAESTTREGIDSVLRARVSSNGERASAGHLDVVRGLKSVSWSRGEFESALSLIRVATEVLRVVIASLGLKAVVALNRDLDFARSDNQTDAKSSNCSLRYCVVSSILVEGHRDWSVGQSSRGDSSGSEFIARSSSAIDGNTVDGVGRECAWGNFSYAP